MKIFNIFIVIFLFILLGKGFIQPGIYANYGDINRYYYPLKHLVQENIIKGELPLWNPYIFSGTPLLANPQSAVFYPFTILFYVFPLDTAFKSFYLVHLFLIGLFTFLFFRVKNKIYTTALVSAITISLSPFIFLRLRAGHPVILSGYIWLPLIYWFLTSTVNKKSNVTSTDGTNTYFPSDTHLIVGQVKSDATFITKIFALNWTKLLFTAVSLSLCFLSGHIQAFYVITLFLGLYSLLYPRLIISFIFVFIFTLLLVSVQFLPTLEFTFNSHRSVNWDQTLSGSYSIPPANLINLILPDSFGNPDRGNFITPEFPSRYFELHTLYFGIFSFAIAIIGYVILIRKKKFSLPILSLLFFILSFGIYTPLFPVLYRVLPGLEFFRAPARFYLIIVWCAILALSLGWEEIFYPAKSLSKNNRNFPGKQMVKLCLIILICGDLYFVNHKFLAHPNQKIIESAGTYNPIARWLQNFADTYRIVSSPTIADPNRAMLYHLYNLNGYDAMIPSSFTRFVHSLNSPTIQLTTVGAEFNSYCQRTMYLAGVKFYLTTPEKPPMDNGILKLQTPTVHVYENKLAVPIYYCVYAQQDSQISEWKYVLLQTDILANTRYKFQFNPNIAVMLVISGTIYPGWVLRDWKGKIPYSTDNIMYHIKSFTSGKFYGKNSIILSYEPTLFYVGLILTLTVMLFLLVFSMYKIFRYL